VRRYPAHQALVYQDFQGVLILNIQCCAANECGIATQHPDGRHVVGFDHELLIVTLPFNVSQLRPRLDQYKR